MFKNSLIAILVSVFILTIALIPSQLHEALAVEPSAPTLAIGAPTGNTVNVGTDDLKITVTWTDSTTGTLQWKVTDGLTIQTVSSKTAAFTYTSSAAKESQHCFTVQRTLPTPSAISAKKCSPVQSVITPALLQTGLTSVKISWTQTAATDPAATPSGYKVERVLRATPTTQVCSSGTSPSGPCSPTFIQLTPSPSTATTYTNTGLVAGSEYCYEIQASWPSPRSYTMDSDKQCIKLDNTPPVISVTVTPSAPTGANGWYTDSPKVVWTVTENESPTTVIKTGCVDTTFNSDTPTGGTTLTCSATSVGGASATTSVTIKRDATKPVITLNGATPLYLRDNGIAFADPGAIITDATSGPAGPVVATNNVDTSTAEVYSRVYTGQDNAGNNAVPVTGIVDVVHVNLDTTKNAYSIGDNVYVTVIDYLAWRDNSISFVSADIRSILPDVASTTRELISSLRVDRTQGEGVFTNQNPVTLVLNDDCLSELPQPTCQEPLLTVVVNDDVQATYITFDTAKARVAENVGGFLGAPPRTTDTVRFVESDRYQLGGSATVKVNDAAANTNPATAQSVTVQIKSSVDNTGFPLTLNEDSINSGTFTGSTAVAFTTGSTSAPAIKVIIDGTVTATYGSNTAQLTIVANDNVAFATGNAVDISRRDACSTDQDGDGICDAWETATGLRIPTTVSGVDYFIGCTASATILTDPTGQSVCPSTTQKDVYLEIDYMLGHAPNNDALNDVTTALKNAPIRGLPGGAVNGIVLHRFLGESTSHQKLMPYTAGSGVPSFLNVKQQFFGTPTERADVNANALLTAKRQVFHWAYFGHGQTGDENSSGLGEKPGNDFWITLGAFTGKQGTRGQQAGTLLHELGHNFGLGHGGADEDNCKGNYLSVMNYLFQFDTPDGGFVSGRPLAYSYYKFSDINENALREDVASITSQSKPTIIGGAILSGTITPFTPTLTNTNVIIDWNRNGATAGSYAQDTNYFAAVSDCQILASGAPLKSTLTGYNDGANLVYNFRGQSTFDSGAVVINQVHTTTSTDGTVTDEEFQTTLSDIPNQSGDEGIAAFSGSGQYGDPDADTIVGTIDWGDGTTPDSLDITPVTDVGATFSFGPHTYADDNPTGTSSDPYTITVKITATRTDAGSNVYSYDSTNTATFTVNNVAPAISVTNNGPVSEGGSATITVAATDVPADTMKYSFDCANDGTFEIGPQDDNFASCSAPDNPSITVGVKAEDDDGGVSPTSTTTVTVNNVPPVITSLTNNGPVNEGGSAMITVAATDVPADTVSYSFDCANDGTFEIGPQASGSASCPAPDNPSITVAVKASDEDGGSTPSSTIVTINNVAPLITSVTNNGPVNAGSSATITVTATDVPADTVSYSFDCNNDGTFETGPQASNSALCLAPSAPSLTVGVRASDEDGGVSPTSTTTVTVNPSFSVTFTKIHSGDTISKSKKPSHLDIEWIVKDAAGNIVPPTAATVTTQYTITITPTSPSGATFPGTSTAFIKDDVPTTVDYHQPKSVLTAGTTYTFNVLRDGIIIGQLTNVHIIT